MIKRCAIVLVGMAVATLVMISIGCNSSPVDPGSSVPNAPGTPSYRAIVGSDPADSGQPTIPMFKVNEFVLDNGIILSVKTIEASEGNIQLDVEYSLPDQTHKARRLILGTDLASVSMYSVDGDFIYGYEVIVDDEFGVVEFRHRTKQDEFSIVYSEGGMRQQFELNGAIGEVRFSSLDEIDRVTSLMERDQEIGFQNLTSEDVLLCSRLAGIREILQTQNSIQDNLDAEVTVYLMAHEPFLTALIHQGRVFPELSLSLPKLCAAASLVAMVSCPFFLTGWGAVVCVPATGVSVVCAIAVPFQTNLDTKYLKLRRSLVDLVIQRGISYECQKRPRPRISSQGYST